MHASEKIAKKWHKLPSWACNLDLLDFERFSTVLGELTHDSVQHDIGLRDYAVKREACGMRQAGAQLTLNKSVAVHSMKIFLVFSEILECSELIMGGSDRTCVYMCSAFNDRPKQDSVKKLGGHVRAACCRR